MSGEGGEEWCWRCLHWLGCKLLTLHLSEWAPAILHAALAAVHVLRILLPAPGSHPNAWGW